MRRTEIRLMALGLALATSGAVAGCGGSSAPSKASYDSQANSICASYNSKLQSATSNLSGSSSVTQVENVLSSAVSLAQQGTNKLRSLKQPSGESGQLDKAYSAQQAQITDLQNAVTALKANNVTAAKNDIAQADGSSSSVNQQFDTLGLTTCGSGSSGSSGSGS